MNPGQFIC